MWITVVLGLATAAFAQEPAAPKGLKDESNLPDRYPYVVQDILKYCQPQRGFWVDLGSGKGQVAIPLIHQTDNPVVMLDPDEEAMSKGLEIAREKGLEHRLVAVVGVAEDMPFPDNSVDLLVSRGSIFFWDDPVKGLQEVYRVLRTGAKAYIGGGAGSGYPKWAADQLIQKRRERMNGEEAEKWKRFVELRRPEQMQKWAEEAKLPEFEVMGKGAISAEDPRVGQGVWLLFEKKPDHGSEPGASRTPEQYRPKQSNLLDVDYRALVSRADLIYQSPAAHSVEGQPIGNGTMGTMVWTTPDSIRFQINRTDLFAVNKGHMGHDAWRGAGSGPTDYGGGVAQITLSVEGDPFRAGEAFLERLSLYDAEVRIEGAGVRARCFVSSLSDVLVLEVDDQRPQPQTLRLTVSMWRDPEVKHGDHVARYDFAELPDRLLVEQRFTERDYYCGSALAARIVADDVTPEPSTARARTLVARPSKGARTILVATAASWSPQDDLGGKALELLDEASAHSYDALRREHAAWWSGFWSRAFVHVESPDGLGDFMERVRHLHLYYMASSSRGPVPPKWNGSIFITDGDTRAWGSQYWVWTTEMAYFPLFAADAVDLTDPYFRMYVKQLPACEQAAIQRWGAEGAFFPETTPFDGPVVLPDDVVQEYQDVFFGRKDPKSISGRLRAICSFESHLNCSTISAHKKQYSWISHVASSGAELAVQAWWRYRSTGDKQWLRESGYPLLRGTAEFYRSLVKKGDDGRYHIHKTNVHEDFWGVDDSIMDLAAVRGTVPLAIRAAKILQTDAELCNQWEELLDNLAAYPMGSDPRAKALSGGALADDVWAAGYLGDVDGHHNPEDVWLNPVFPFEHWTLETRDPESDRIVKKLVQLAPRFRTVLDGEGLNTVIRTPIAAVRAGAGEQLPAILASYYPAFAPMANGMGLFEGSGKMESQAHSIEALGSISSMLQDGLMQSVSPRPGEAEVISVLPAWPNEWRASFRLLARGGFLVSAAAEDGQVALVEIQSRLGETCRLRNPWGTPCRVADVGGAVWEVSGDVLCFDTRAGGHYHVFPTDQSAPLPRVIQPGEATSPASYRFTLSNGRVVQGQIGRGR